MAMSFDMDGIPITSNIGRDRGYSRQSLPDINNAANNPSGALFPSIEEESYNEDAIGVRAPGFRSDLEDENDGFGFKLSPDVGADQRSTNYQPSSPSAIMLPTNSDLTPPPGLGKRGRSHVQEGATVLGQETSLSELRVIYYT